MDAELAAAVMPFVTAAAGAYGAAVVDRVRDAAAEPTADAVVELGRRVLRRILGRPGSTGVGAAVTELAEDPTDGDRVAAARLRIRQALAADARLAAEVAEAVRSAGASVSASGARSVAVRTNGGIVQTGDGGHARQYRREPR